MKNSQKENSELLIMSSDILPEICLPEVLIYTN